MLLLYLILHSFIFNDSYPVRLSFSYSHSFWSITLNKLKAVGNFSKSWVFFFFSLILVAGTSPQGKHWKTRLGRKWVAKTFIRGVGYKILIYCVWILWGVKKSTRNIMLHTGVDTATLMVTWNSVRNNFGVGSKQGFPTFAPYCKSISTPYSTSTSEGWKPFLAVGDVGQEAAIGRGIQPKSRLCKQNCLLLIWLQLPIYQCQEIALSG